MTSFRCSPTLSLSRWSLCALLLLLATAGACSGDGSADESASDVSASVDFAVDGILADDASERVTQGDGAPTDGPGGLPDDCPGSPDCPCTENSDCDTSACIDTPEGRACARTCIETCPAGFRCTATGESDVKYLCMPKFLNLCAPCQADLECEAPGSDGEICVDYGDIGSFCGTSCEADTDCPAEHVCKSVTGVNSDKKKQCVRKGASAAELGVCECTKRAIKLARATSCFVTQDVGDGPVKCKGQRSCSETGLTPCAAPPAAKEQCDGLDEDCDGKIDEQACDDGNPCTLDICDPTAPKDKRCVHQLTTDSCVLADGNPCFVDNVCVKGTCAPGKARDCNDKNPCTDDSCDPKTAGKGETGCVNKPISGAACDDGQTCTTNEKCEVGKCVASGPLCSDGNPCTTDVCGKDDKCTHADVTGACDDGNKCTTGETCKGGACIAAKTVCKCTDNADCKQQEDGDLCNGTLICDKATFPYACKVDPATLVTCKKATGLCDGQVCAPKTGKCGFDSALTGKSCDADGNKCTSADACKDGKCVVGAALNCDDKNPCTKDSCNAVKGCVHEDTKAICDDGNGCTYSDKCDAATGKCVGVAKTCNDGQACTKDTCDTKSGVCKFAPIIGCDGYCLVHKDCDDKQECTLQKCVSNKCFYENKVGSCTDPDGCVLNATCAAGKCQADKVARQSDFFGSGKASGVDAKSATQSSVNTPTGIAIHPATGNLWVADAKLNAIRLVPANGGPTTTVAGNIKGHKGFVDGKAGKSRYNYPRDITWSKSGFFFVADQLNRRIRKIAPNTMTTTAAGNGITMPKEGTSQGDGTKLSVGEVMHLAADSAGGVYFSSQGTNDVWQLTGFGSIKRIAGAKQPGMKDGPANTARFGTIAGLAVDCVGRVVVADSFHSRLRRIDAKGMVTTIAGQTLKGLVAGPALGGGALQARLQNPSWVQVDASGTIWFLEHLPSNTMLRRLSADGATVVNVAGKGTTALNAVGTQSVLKSGTGLAVKKNGVVFAADRDAHKVVRIWESTDACGFGSQCVRAYMPNPDNACQACVPTVSKTTWSKKPSGMCKVCGL
ncbi:MAG: hypothetical protein KC502_22140 [Myxococcales bacterium]|nr:hypothetical protein [Myxococcales bacterium]